MSGEANRRVTNAILATKLDLLIEKVDKTLDDHEQRIRTVETKTTRLSVAHPVLSVIGSVLAGIWGSSR